MQGREKAEGEEAGGEGIVGNWDAEKGWPRGPHTDPTGQWESMKGGEVKNFGMQKAFSFQPRSQMSPTLFTPNIIHLPGGGSL